MCMRVTYLIGAVGLAALIEHSFARLLYGTRAKTIHLGEQDTGCSPFCLGKYLLAVCTYVI